MGYLCIVYFDLNFIKPVKTVLPIYVKVACISATKATIQYLCSEKKGTIICLSETQDKGNAPFTRALRKSLLTTTSQ